MGIYKIYLLGVIVSLTLLFYLVDCQILEGRGAKLPNNGICPSIDVRNDPRNLEKLRNCTVIVGLLQIVLINNGYNIADYVFPELREITDYLLLYRVDSMISLGTMFPNLSLIRGRNLFYNYALVIFEMPHLKEVGLKSLISIERGFIRMTRNPQLCYVNSVNWEIITRKPNDHNVFEIMKTCPDICRGCTDNQCWNSKHCQRTILNTCNEECKGCNLKEECYRCKHYENDGVCVPTCPKNRVIEPESRRCITEKICSNLARRTAFVFKNQCITSCPIGYNMTVINRKRTCQYCGNECNTVCHGAEITSVGEAQMLSKCHTIMGTLIIKLQYIYDSNLMDELEMGLGNIREITGYLKVHRSPGVTSLNFLRDLTVIGGKELHSNRYAVVIYEMINLNSLWNWNVKKKLKFNAGTISFHYNPKLCVSDIKKLAEMTNSTYDAYDVCPSSNGYKESCHLVAIKADCYDVDKTHAVITWERYIRNITKEDIDRKDAGYILYYFENAYDNISTHLGIDSCGKSTWSTEFIEEVLGSTPKNLSRKLTNLVSYTRYAYYVESYSKVLNKSYEDARSEIKFFTTKMKKPTQPILDIDTAHDSINISWRLSPKYKGVASHYLIKLEIQPADEEPSNVNYCELQYRFTAPTPKVKIPFVENEEYPTCDCDDIDDYRMSQRITEDGTPERDVYQSHFKKPPKNVDKSNEFNIDELLGIEDDNNNFDIEKNVTHDGKYHLFFIRVDGNNSNVSVNNLQHFRKYMVYVSACISENNCGMSAMRMIKTMYKENADVVKNVSVKSTLKSDVMKLTWDKPNDPNGLIVGYVVQHKPKDDESSPHHRITEACITKQSFLENNRTFLMTEMTSGLYYVRIKTLTSAMNSKFCDWQEFSVPDTFPSTVTIVVFFVILVIVVCAVVRWMYSRRTLVPISEDSRMLVGSESSLTASGVRLRRGRRDTEEIELSEIES